MTAQPSLWDIEAGRDARDQSLADVAVHSAPWSAVARDALHAVARRQERVTSDDVWAELDAMGIARPIEGRAMGPVMVRGVREGVIAPDGYTQGTDPRHHADIARLYRSLVSR